MYDLLVLDEESFAQAQANMNPPRTEKAVMPF